MLRSLTLPVILIDRGVPGTEMDCVCVNDYDGGYLAGQKLTRLSHSRFLYITGPPRLNPRFGVSKEFFMHCRMHLPSDALRIISFKEINRAIKQNTILQLLHPINYTAIIAYNDEFAYYVMNTLRQNGYRIPEDISICGFDHICSSMSYLPPLSSISYPKDRSLAQTGRPLPAQPTGASEPTGSDR